MAIEMNMFMRRPELDELKEQLNAVQTLKDNVASSLKSVRGWYLLIELFYKAYIYCTYFFAFVNRA